MKDKKRERRGKVSRREFLKAGVAGLGMAAMGGLTEKAFGAPAVIKGTKLTILALTSSHRAKISTRSKPRSGARPTACR
jgi:hypothetical protein